MQATEKGLPEKRWPGRRWVGKFPDMGDVIARFPVPTVLMAAFTLIWIFESLFSSDEQMRRLMAGLVVAGYLCVSIVLAAETKGASKKLPLQILLAVIIAALAWFSESLRLNLPMAIGAAVLLLGNAVLWRQKRDDLHVWDFTHKLWTGAVFATVGSLIFTAGIFSISAALDSLLGIDIENMVKDIILPIGLGFLAPLYWMATLPPVDEDYSELYKNPSFVSKAVAFLGTWLLSPLTLIFALILLAYGVKIAVTGTLPKGEIAGMTTPFLIVGTLTWLMLDPPFVGQKKLAKLFRKLWWPVSMPAAILLAIAVYIRVGEYGFTPERIALIALFVWAFGLALWFTFGPKARRDIRLIPGAAAVLLAIGSLSAGWISTSNQTSRAKTSLIASGIMSEAGVIAAQKDIVITDSAAAWRAKGALAYLKRHDEEDRLKALLGEAYAEPNDAYEYVDRLALNTVNNEKFRNAYVSYNHESGEPISVAGFEQLHGPYKLYKYDADNRHASSKSDEVKFDETKANEVKAEYGGGLITITRGGAVLARFELDDWLSGLSTSSISGGSYNDVTFEIENPMLDLVTTDGSRAQLIIRSLSANWQDTESKELSFVSVDVFVLTGAPKSQDETTP